MMHGKYRHLILLNYYPSQFEYGSMTDRGNQLGPLAQLVRAEDS
jgi:hypothetical protein